MNGYVVRIRYTSPIVWDMFKTIGEVVLSALNGVGTQCSGRRTSVTTTTLSCGGRDYVFLYIREAGGNFTLIYDEGTEE